MNRRYWMLALATISISVAVGAGEPAYERSTYRFSDKQVEFIRDPRLSLTVSTNCLGKNRSTKCLAIQAFESASLDALPRPVPGGRPDYVLRRQALCEIAGGRVVIGQNVQGGESPFCYFKKDQTLVGIGSLWAAAVRHRKPRR